MGIFAVVVVAAALGLMTVAFRRLLALSVESRDDWFTEVARRVQWLMSGGALLAVLGLLAALDAAKASPVLAVLMGAFGFAVVVMLAYPFSASSRR